MIAVPEIVLNALGVARGETVCDNASLATPRQIQTTGFISRMQALATTSLFELCLRAARQIDVSGACCVIAATFSHEKRFPSLAVQLATTLGLPRETMAFDLQMACSAYPYALFVGGQIAAAVHKPVLVVEGDIQSRLTDPHDSATNFLFSDAATATLISSDSAAVSQFAALSEASDALSCPAEGPIHMDGFKVFSFVAERVVPFLQAFNPSSYEVFVPHQANLYMVRQLARALSVQTTLISDGTWANPGGCSIPLLLSERRGEVNGKKLLLAGFGAGLSAAALTARLALATKDSH